ncbi:ADAM 17-like protease [Pocillopora verrucosa]|uniref:ADAM 17-like protease n=1 Tax=Pocillopora verrucosa TaxID=203993 RepID=UPI0033424E17
MGVLCYHLALLFSLALNSIFEVNAGEIRDVVRHYETLHTGDIFHDIHKRDVNNKEKTLSFTTLNRHFRLHLTPHSELFAEDFHAYSVAENYPDKEVTVDLEGFYKGYDEGDSTSRARVHVDHGIITASIATKDDIYIVEPAWRHIAGSSQDQMISYRHSDVKSNITNAQGQEPNVKKKFSFCGHDSHHSPVLYADEEDSHAQGTYSKRKRRAAPTRIRCRLALVADYRFFTEMGRGDTKQTINYMIGVIDRVDSIFQRTAWSEEYKGYGFEIQKVLVHETPTRETDHYNKDTSASNPWEIKKLLNAFSRNEEWLQYCLAHLFTYQDFADGVIGLAYVGNPKSNAVGGICTKRYFTNNRWLYLNTGLSSSINWGRKLLTEEADIVTAHEIGHNFGSEHDPETTECAPPESNGGKFIMYPASVSGQWRNNKLFSPCSKRRILNVLQSKSSCFHEPRAEICGNYKKEKEEECDPGGIVAQESQCCTANCKLKDSALCSDGYDSPCCKDCLYNNSTGILCREADPTTCKGSTYCDGKSAQCPAAPNMPDGAKCIDSGTCRNGVCKPFCEALNLKPCKCSGVDDSCKVCCQGSNGICAPHRDNNTGSTLDILDGRSCQGEGQQGTCVKGKCEKLSQDLVERFWTFITTLDSNTVAQFMKDNLAGTVVVFSLLIWVPASCYVNRIDRKHDKRESLEAEWRDPKNTQLLRQPVPTNKGKFVYRQDSITRSSQPDKPFKIKPKNIRTHRTPQLEYTAQRETYM